MSQFNFGSNLGASTSQTGFSFGTPKTNAPTFGTIGSTTQTQPSGSITFGTPIASVAPTVQGVQGGTFGTPTLGSKLNFGTPTTTAGAPTGLNFGTPAKTTGLAFVTPTTQVGLFATPVTQTGLNFGAPTTATPATFAPTFGAPSATSATTNSLTFGAPTTTTNVNPLSGINFNAPATNFNLGSVGSTPQTSLSFGTSIPSTGLNFGLGGATTSTAPSLNFKSSLTPATTISGLNFGLPVSKSTPLSLPTVTSAPLGLGGVDSSQLKTGIVATGRSDTVTAKENQVPNEILQSIESFKQFVKDQKSLSSDVSRGSARSFIKVREDIDMINSILTEVGNDLQKNQQQADKLKHDSAKCLQNAEMAQRTYDTPPGLQFENNAPLKYFVELVNQFEQDLQALRVQIDVTDKHFQSLHEPKFLTSQELATGMRRLHDTFVALAGRLHSVHTQVESHKEQYLNLRKYILKDPTNIFMQPALKEEQALDVALRGLAANKSVSGPTPFSSLTNSPFGMNMQTKPPPAYPATTSTLNFGGSPATSQLGAAGGLFGNVSMNLGQTQSDSSFQLQNPPPGNKRGKR